MWKSMNVFLIYLKKKKEIEHDSRYSEQNPTPEIYAVTFETIVMIILLYIYISSVY